MTAPTVVTTARGPVEVMDSGAGVPVLVVHGSPGGHDQGQLMAGFLPTAEFRAIIPSRPGYLGTPLTAENGPIDAQADLYAALLDERGIDRAAVLCWSGGGPSTYRFAVRYPDRVTGVVALAALTHDYHWHMGLDERFMFGTRAGDHLMAMLAQHAPHRLVAGTLRTEGRLTDDQLEELTEQVFADPVKRDFVLRLATTVNHRNRRPGIENDRDTFAAITDLQLQKVTAPVLLVQGDADAEVVPEYSRYAAERLPHSQTVNIPLGTHVAAFTAADSAEVQQRIMAFLRSPTA